MGQHAAGGAVREVAERLDDHVLRRKFISIDFKISSDFTLTNIVCICRVKAAQGEEEDSAQRPKEVIAADQRGDGLVEQREQATVEAEEGRVEDSGEGEINVIIVFINTKEINTYPRVSIRGVVCAAT